MKILHFLSRLIVGLVFIFSGFVKGVDPLGTAYRIEDYFIAWNAQDMMPYALSLSILLSTMEFVLGVVVLLNLKPRVNAWILLAVMGFFTLLTLNDAIYNPVPDCGCFGDAITLTNWQTFYKNVILMVFTLVLLLLRKKTKGVESVPGSYGTAAAAAIVFIAFSLYNYRHLPIIDFMAWKKGNKMYIENPLPVKYFLKYRNKETGEVKEYLSPDYPYNDSVWMSQWEFVDQRVEDPNQYQGHDLQIMDSVGTDYTESVIRNPDHQFILVAWDILAANEKALSRMEAFATAAASDGLSFVALTSSLPEDIEKARRKLNLSFDIFLSDDIALKTMVRANPGLLLLKDGIVIDKWHYNDFPEYKEFSSRYRNAATGK